MDLSQWLIRLQDTDLPPAGAPDWVTGLLMMGTFGKTMAADGEAASLTLEDWTSSADVYVFATWRHGEGFAFTKRGAATARATWPALEGRFNRMHAVHKLISGSAFGALEKGEA